MHQFSDIKETNDPSGSRINQIFDKMFEDLDKSSFKSCIIFKVNVRLRESNPDAYTPKMVSIGPYHRKNPQLHPMEKYKLLYLQRFLKREKGVDVQMCMKMLEGMKEDALKCYDDIENLDTDEFCKMLLLDGYFVVEFIWEHSKIYPKEENKIIDFVDYKYNQILRDLLLLENQLPFFILYGLHDMKTECLESPFEELAITLFRNVVNLGYMSVHSVPYWTMKSFASDFLRRRMKHLLQLVHVASCPEISKNWSNYNNDTKRNKVMPNATELSEAGVRFAKFNHKTSLFDIRFDNGLMTIPSIDVVDSTETLLRNFIAYEQQSTDLQYLYFSDYATFMNHLIDSDKDVNLLRRKKIISIWIGEDKEVASLFNKLGNGVIVFSNFYYTEVFLEAFKHCYEKPSNRWKASLKHNYFSSPWVGASTLTVIILFILTIIQTVLAIISIFK